MSESITTRCGSMFGLGMRLPRKSRDKTRTLHACVLCDLVNYCVFGVHDMFHVLKFYVCLVISTWMCQKIF